MFMVMEITLESYFIMKMIKNLFDFLSYYRTLANLFIKITVNFNIFLAVFQVLILIIKCYPNFLIIIQL